MLKMDRIDEVGMPTCDEETEYAIRIMMNGRGPQRPDEIALCDEWLSARREYFQKLKREAGTEGRHNGGKMYTNKNNVFKMANERLKKEMKKRRCLILWQEGLPIKEICETLQTSRLAVQKWLGE